MQYLYLVICVKWKLSLHEEKYDPFKNSQIVLFVYITQGTIHGQHQVGKIVQLNLPKYSLKVQAVSNQS